MMPLRPALLLSAAPCALLLLVACGSSGQTAAPDAAADAAAKDSAADATTVDSSTPVTDSGVVDTGALDSTTTDTGSEDSATGDTGASDTGSLDSGHADSGSETGPFDAGNACVAAGGSCVALAPGSCANGFVAMRRSSRVAEASAPSAVCPPAQPPSPAGAASPA